MMDDIMTTVGNALDGPNGDLLLWITLAVVLTIVGVAMWYSRKPTQQGSAKPKETPFVFPVDEWRGDLAAKRPKNEAYLAGVQPRVAKATQPVDDGIPVLTDEVKVPGAAVEVTHADVARVVAAALKKAPLVKSAHVKPEGKMSMEYEYESRDALIMAIGGEKPTTNVRLDGKDLWVVKTGMDYKTQPDGVRVVLVTSSATATPVAGASQLDVGWPRNIHVGGVNMMAKAPVNEAWRPGLTASILGRPPTGQIVDPSDGDLVGMPLRSPAGFPLSYTIVKDADGARRVVGTATIFHADNGFSSDAEVLAYIAATNRTPAQEAAIAAEWSRADAEVRRRLTDPLPTPQRAADTATEIPLAQG